ncbi:hypothetical protein [Zhenhengia yiwuensis]|uniref:Uncharacterized protein n=1 Tax=Zhenhengia yiwuensis TaxID=2763666 RepID=A0A926IDQ1_9FIRM|nr:hypothetical protein [Zhenhengia yiwuensis]MBC8578933.1 hypothetical protein [Zhenhengia yiwuensis]
MNSKIKKCVFLFILTLMVNLIIFVRFMVFPQNEEQIIGQNLVSITEDINMNNTIIQTLIPNNDTIVGMEIFFSTFNRENPGNTNISLLDGDKEIFNYEIDNSKIIDNEYLELDNLRINVEKGHVYTLMLSSDNSNEGITAWKDAENNLVLTIEYAKVLNILQIIFINVVFLILNIVWIKLFTFLKR